ncbi:OmpA family protein [Echinicola jeungdonensis]|uniref:OmpA family protein n=1 Tax=Echinicola jeungdonensis TaxID=709343 RepID=A0ABV5J6A9_9BACT|nr:OmpA family protein [Echinicola jeungdonensis]MDN3669320.1 OmpA family protein [Echinicola jeungdonensis]
MKRIFTFLIFMALFTAISSDLMAQNALLRYADKQFELFHYQEASEVYAKAFNRKHTYRAAKGAAKSFQKINDYEKAYEWWKTTLAFESSTTQDYAKFIASANQLGKIEEVKEALDTLSARDERFDQINIDSLMGWYENPKLVEAIPVDSVNSAATDFGGAEDKKGNFYFASDRGETSDSGKPLIRFDVANKIEEDEYAWTGRDFLTVYKVSEEGQVSTLKSPVPDTYHFSDPYFMENEDVVFYTITRELDKKAKKKLRKSDKVNPEMDYGQGQDDFADYHSEIFYSKINDSGEFEGFNSLPFNSLLNYSVINPFLDEKNKVMYFASDMPGGFGGYDLYKVSYDEDFTFGEPENLGDQINSKGNERDPFLAGDVLYFSSDGHFGLGGLDIFMAQLEGGNFSDIQNMGVPYNSSQDDFAMMLGRDGKEYLSSNRLGGSGLDDIYLMKDMYRRFMARVLNCDGELITDGYVAELREMDKMEKISLEKGSQGEVLANVSPSSDFELKISKKGYFPIIDNSISTKGIEADKLEREYTLAPIPYRTTVYADLIYYDLDKDAIREDAKPALNKLADLMKDHSFLDLMVRSHTDSRASVEYNDGLSSRRANAVASYLDSQGVAHSRVKKESFGEEKLTNDCGDGVPCPEREHQLNRRSELVLMAFPDENKQYEMPEELKGLDFCNISNLGVPVDVPLIHFDFDRYFLRTEDKKELERLAIMLSERPEATLSIEGHTDIRGSEEYNEALSEERAKVVRDFLIKRGIDESRIKYSWHGKSLPIHECESSCTEKEHQLNRRTEVKLILGQASESKPLKGSMTSIGKKKTSEELKSEEEVAFFISGVFSSEDNAASRVSQLKSKGFADAGFYFDQEKSLYYCYISKSTDRELAKKILANLKTKVSEDIWILEM